MKKVLTDILLPYFIMETIWSLVQFLVEGKREFNPTKPRWTLWFLLALGDLPAGPALPGAAALAAALGGARSRSASATSTNVDTTFSLSRAIGILPFFVLGWQLRQWGLVDRWRRARAARSGGSAPPPSSCSPAGSPSSAVHRRRGARVDLRYWFFYDDSYRGLGEDQLVGRAASGSG